MKTTSKVFTRPRKGAGSFFAQSVHFLHRLPSFAVKNERKESKRKEK